MERRKGGRKSVTVYALGSSVFIFLAKVKFFFVCVRVYVYECMYAGRRESR